MRLIARCAALLTASIFCASCERAAIEPSESLVGAKLLPSSSDLSRETIQIYFGYDEDLSHRLSYELRPDDSWTVTISEASDYEKSSHQKFDLSPARAMQVRKQLWRVRPEGLKGVEWSIRPADCPPPPTDTSTMLAVGFVAEGPKPGVEDDRIGVFELPYPRTCNTKQGIEARELLDEVMNELPRSELRSKYRHYPPLG